MGRIKSKLIKRTGKNLITGENNFTSEFDENKKMLQDLMPSKKVRNQVAGYITRKKKETVGKSFNNDLSNTADKSLNNDLGPK